MTPHDQWRLSGPDKDRHEVGKPCGRVPEPDEDQPRDRYPYRHNGPAVHGSKLADYLISEANLREDKPELLEDERRGNCAFCAACNGRGYHRCDCWPGDCICGWDDETCEECSGEGRIYHDDDWDCWHNMDKDE